MIAALMLMAAPVPPPPRLRASLDVVADRCGISRSAFKLTADGLLHFQPPESMPYKQFDCAMAQLKKRGLAKRLPLAIVGRESYDAELKQ